MNMRERSLRALRIFSSGSCWKYMEYTVRPFANCSTILRTVEMPLASRIWDVLCIARGYESLLCAYMTWHKPSLFGRIWNTGEIFVVAVRMIWMRERRKEKKEREREKERKRGCESERERGRE
jgi:hypothetical protein